MKSRIGANVRSAMKDKDITSAELARRLDDHERNVRRWRNGEVAPNLNNLAALAMELDRDPGWFYADNATSQTSETNSTRTVTAAGCQDKRS